MMLDHQVRELGFGMWGRTRMGNLLYYILGILKKPIIDITGRDGLEMNGRMSNCVDLEGGFPKRRKELLNPNLITPVA